MAPEIYFTAPDRSTYYRNPPYETPARQYGLSANNAPYRYGETVERINRNSDLVLRQFRDLGRSYQRIAGVASDEISRMMGLSSDANHTAREVSRQSVALARKTVSSSSSGMFSRMLGGFNAIIGGGDFLMHVANDYDRGDGNYRRSVVQATKATTQAAVFAGVASGIGATLGGAAVVAAAPAVLTVGTGVVAGAAASYGIGRMFDWLFGS